MKHAELVQCIYNAILTCVCKVSLQRRNKPGRNSTWISDLSVDNQKQLFPHIHQMENVAQGRRWFNPILSINQNHKKAEFFLVLSQVRFLIQYGKRI